MKIEPNKFYRTRSGQKARIYAVDGGTIRNIHGAIEYTDGWSIRDWRGSGRIEIFDGDEDLISEWTDTPQKKKLYAYLKRTHTCEYTIGYFDKEGPNNGLRCPSRDLEVEV